MMLFLRMNFLEYIDAQMLLVLNAWHTPVADRFVWLLSERISWLLFYLTMVMVVARTFPWEKSILIYMAVAIAVLAADQICGSILRPLIARMRPSNPDNPIAASITLVNGYRGGRFGFPSCHAANAGAVAMLLIHIFRNRITTVVLSLWALLLCYTRAYMGVHYPADLLCGLIIGGGIGWCIWIMLRPRFISEWIMTKKANETGAIIIAVSFAVNVIIMWIAALCISRFL